ncbi:hypothetical protein [Stackebrandtia nassauensis]|uniref:Uncharacterized protein n=1 Tax=Stackebrandtia nassauensis (strain DSM 44728 / CIP 108903 / NRRL B-16338 / NBRC 102104 / LLR-40K-21) TaxID=446470 RepID=D3PVM9_STANL|nr:hypothetical protein [Stackebrandtia nassauensis]ADD43143.1 hypothetical protein Snas_3480 [Stackebrandtia nassauensis DSM 44728]
MNRHDALERRYRRLLRFYPKEYRTERGKEIVDTYMEATPPERTTPGVADVGDVAKAGLRQRLRDAPEGLPGGLRLAAVVGLCLAVGIGAVFGPAMEILAREGEPATSWFTIPSFGPFLSPFVILWTLWLLVGVGAALLPGRITRRVVAGAVVATVAAELVTFFVGGLATDPLSMAALILFGVISLAWPEHPGPGARIAPLVAACAGIATTLGYAVAPPPFQVFGIVETPLLILLLAAVILFAEREVRSRRGSGQRWWAVAILAVPVSIILLRPVERLPFLDTMPFIPGAFWLLGLGLAIPIVSYLVAVRRHRLTRR